MVFQWDLMVIPHLWHIKNRENDKEPVDGMGYPHTKPMAGALVWYPGWLVYLLGLLLAHLSRIIITRSKPMGWCFLLMAHGWGINSQGNKKWFPFGDDVIVWGTSWDNSLG